MKGQFPKIDTYLVYFEDNPERKAVVMKQTEKGLDLVNEIVDNVDALLSILLGKESVG
jgi:hypothetical protein